MMASPFSLALRSTLPTCSSSGDIPLSPEITPSSLPHFPIAGCTGLHAALMSLGVVDEKGSVIKEFTDRYKLPPIRIDEVSKARLETLRKQLVNNFKTLPECLSYFQTTFGVPADTCRVVGSTFYWLFGTVYCCEVLRMIGVVNPERFFPPSVVAEWEKHPNDFDIRMYLEWAFAQDFVDVQIKFEHFLQQSPTDKVNYRKPPNPIHATGNHTVTFSTDTVDFNLYYELQSEFLCRHNGLQFNCDFLFDEHVSEETLVYPCGAKGVDPWQSFFDRLLKIIYPHQNVNNPGWFKIVLDMTKGYCINDIAIWDRLKGYKFRRDGKILPMDMFYKRLKDCTSSHGLGNTPGLYFNALNAAIVLGEGLSTSDFDSLWQKISDGDVVLSDLPPVIVALHRLLTAQNVGHPRAFALLQLCCFLSEIHVPEESAPFNARVVFLEKPSNASFQLTFPSAAGQSLHLQMQGSIVECYRLFLSLRLSDKIEPLIWEFFSQFFVNSLLTGNASGVIAGSWKVLGMERRELRQEIIKNVDASSDLVRMVNYLLIAALHKIEPLPVTEMLLLEQFPLVYKMGRVEPIKVMGLLESVLGPLYASPLNIYHQHQKSENCINLWIQALIQHHHPIFISKLAALLPRFRKYFPRHENFIELVASVTQKTSQKHPKQTIEILIHSVEKLELLDLSVFKLYCQTINSAWNAFSPEAVDEKIKELGLVLLNLVRALKRSDIKHSRLKEVVLVHVVEALLERKGECEKIGQQIMEVCSTGHSFQPLFGKVWQYLYRKAFPVVNGVSQTTLPVHFKEHNDYIRQKIGKKDIQAAVYRLIQLINDEKQPSPREALLELVQFVWGQLLFELGKPTPYYVDYASNLIHDNGTQKMFPEFCLQNHLFLMEVLQRKNYQTYNETCRLYFTQGILHFYRHIPHEQKEPYYCFLVSLLPLAWTTSKPLHPDCLKQLTALSKGILSVLNSHSAERFLFLEQLVLLGVPVVVDASDGITIINAIGNELSFPSVTISTQTNLVRVAQNLYGVVKAPLTFETYMSFCCWSFANYKLDTGMDWLLYLLDALDPDDRVSADRLLSVLIPWLTSAEASKKCPKLTLVIEKCEKLNPPPGYFAPIFSEQFIDDHALWLLNFLLQAPYSKVFSEEDPRGDAVVLGLIICRLRSAKTSDENLIKILKLILTSQFKNTAIWMQLLEGLEKRSPECKKQVLSFVHSAYLQGLLQDNTLNRIIVWEKAVSDPAVIDVATAKQWLRHPSELCEIYRYEDGSLTISLLQMFDRLYDIMAEHRSEETSKILISSYAIIRSYFDYKQAFEYYSKLDLKILGCIDGYISAEMFEVFSLTLIERLNLVEIDMPTLSRFTRMRFSDKPERDPVAHIISAIFVNNHQNQWFIPFLCLSGDPEKLERLDLILKYFVDAFEIQKENARNQNVVETFRLSFVFWLQQLIVQIGKTHPLRCLEVIMHPSIRNFIEDQLSSPLNMILGLYFDQVFNANAPASSTDFESALTLFLPYIEFFPDESLHQLFLLSFDKLKIADEATGNVKNAADFFLRICRLSCVNKDPVRDFHSKIKFMLDLVSHQRLGKDPIRSLMFAASVLGTLVQESMSTSIENIKEVESLVDIFCFEMQKVTRETEEVYVNLVLYLLQLCKTVTVQNPNIYMHSDFIFTNPSEVEECRLIFSRQARSRSPFILSLVLHLFSVCEINETIPLTLLRDDIMAYFQTLKARPDAMYAGCYLIGKHNETFLPLLKNLAGFNDEGVLLAQMIAIEMLEVNDCFIGAVKDFMPKKLSPTRYVVELLTNIAETGVFKGNEQMYFEWCERILVQIVRNKLTIFENIVCGTLMTSTELLKKLSDQPLVNHPTVTKINKLLHNDQLELIPNNEWRTEVLIQVSQEILKEKLVVVKSVQELRREVNSMLNSGQSGVIHRIASSSYSP